MLSVLYLIENSFLIIQIHKTNIYDYIASVIAYEESFKIYQGTSTSGTLMYTQPYVENSRTYTLIVCLNGGSHVIQMLDSYGDGWTSESTVGFSAGSTSFGSFNLGSGSSDTDSFTVESDETVDLSDVRYTFASYTIQKGVSFSIAPLNDASNINYSVYSGSLPSGLSLDTSTGVISWTVCLNSGDHVLQLLDSFDDGWRQGSFLSMSI